MPAIASGNQNRVDIFAIEQFTEVAVKSTVRRSIMFVDQCLSGITTAGLHISDGHALDIGKSQHCLKVVCASWPDADNAQSDFLTGSHGTITAKHMGWKNPWCGKRGG